MAKQLKLVRLLDGVFINPECVVSIKLVNIDGDHPKIHIETPRSLHEMSAPNGMDDLQSLIDRLGAVVYGVPTT